jgi:CP family cyanate transporter-like MFS transporter
VSDREVVTNGQPIENDATEIFWRVPLAWTITIVLAGAATMFYSGLTWLGPRYIALGSTEASAGLLVTVFVLAQLPGMFFISGVGDRLADNRPLFVLMIGLIVVSTAGVALRPTLAPWLWASVYGVGSGGLFSLVLTLPVEFADDERATDRLSAMAMGVGFTVAAVGPFVIGAVRDLTGEFTVSFVALTLISLVLLGLSFRLSPEREDIAS